MPTTRLAVTWWPIGRLHPYERNPRSVSDEAVRKVADSIAEFGWRQPIVVDEQGEVVVGHTRLLAARRLGEAKVPVHVARGLTPEQIRAYRLADNRTNEETTWDKGLLAQELAELEAAGVDLELTAFDADEVSELDADGLPYELDDLLRQADLSQAVERPVWLVVRAPSEEAERLRALEEALRQPGWQVETNYG